MADFTFAHRKEGFDNHIEKSIRGYSHLMEDVISLSRYFIENNTNVVDIGCSTGKMTKALIDHNMDHCTDATYIGLEIADGFQKDLIKRAEEVKKYYYNVYFKKEDARDYNYTNCSLVTSIFTLQFMPKTDREKLIRDIYTSLIPGGAFVFAEKVYSQNAHIQDMLTFMYYDYKRKHFEDKDILDKENTLRHMLKPNTWPEINEFLTKAGFKDIQVFWRNHNFLGAIVIK